MSQEEQNQAILKSAAKLVSRHSTRMTLATILTLIGMGTTGLYIYFTQQEGQNFAISANAATTGRLCVFLDESVNRMDQNIQNLGRAFNVAVVTDGAGVNPCK